MVIDYQRFVQIIKEKENAGKLTKEQAMLARNQLAAISRPGCPIKMQAAFGRQLNELLGETVIQI